MIAGYGLYWDGNITLDYEIKTLDDELFSVWGNIWDTPVA